MSNSTGKMLINGVIGLIKQIKDIAFKKEVGPKFITGLRSGWSSKTKKGAKHANRIIGKSAVGLYSRAHGVHWIKA